MSKLIVAVLAVAFVGCAAAEEWPLLQIDASSQRAFKRSLETAKDELSRENLYMLGGALKHIWNEGVRTAEAEDGEYSAKDYFRQIDGLTYEQVVHFTDATYEAAQAEYRAALDGSERAVFWNESPARPPRYVPPPTRYRHNESGTFNRSFRNENEPRGGTDLVGVPGQQ
jgi:hypothetical protein